MSFDHQVQLLLSLSVLITQRLLKPVLPGHSIELPSLLFCMREALQDPAKIPLKAKNLRLSDALSKIDKTQFIDAYVQSQKPYLATYAKEGPLPDVTPKDQSPPLVSTEGDRQAGPTLKSGFDTPILKPRVPLKEPQKDKVLHKAPLPVKSSRKKEEENKENKIRSQRTRDTRHSSSPAKQRGGPALKQQTLDKFKPLKKTIARKDHIVSKKRARDSDTSDGERATRLAERRERRRKKRAVIQPKSKDSEEAPDVCASDNDKTDEKKSQKKKGVSMSTGLALMHGFTANNIGKNRLTIVPEQRGVFSKGRASANMTVKTTSVKRMQAFSESQFLSKSKPKSPAKGEDDNPSSYSGASNENRGISRKRTKKQDARAECSDASSIVEAAGDSSSLINEEHPCIAPAPGSPARKLRTVESVVWDIELEGNELRSDPPASEHLVANSESAVVLNTRSRDWQVKKIVHATDIVSDAHSEPDDGDDDMDSDTPISLIYSIGPSQSASQAGQQLRTMKHTASKFFNHPTNDIAHPLANHIGVATLSDGPQSITGTRLMDVHGSFISPSQAEPAGSTMSLPQQSEDLVASADTVRASAVAQSPASYMSIDSLERELQALDSGSRTAGHTTGTLPCAMRRTWKQAHSYTGYTFAVPSAYFDGLDDSWRDPLDYNSFASAHSLSEDQHTGPESCVLPTGEDCVMQDAHESEDWAIDLSNGAPIRQEHALTYQAPYYLNSLEADQGLVYEGIGYTGDLLSRLSSDEDPLEPDDGPAGQHYPDDNPAFDTLPESIDCLSRPCTPLSCGGLSSDIGSDLPSNNKSIVDSMPHFSQGRALLMGLAERSSGSEVAPAVPYVLSSAEEQVAKSLRGHWLPHKL
ncbi:hypothetical protein IEO21_00721 [Rhodonia placenta]|uniref:Uncharacterized protein n=1 Tax=Rhodonia placenta TaxID=104341 RepID=A0A8H7PBK7_9APHY|nr:hypothetical protein IEO21_00721 [Postia placenta]